METLAELAEAVAVADRYELPGGKCLVCSARCKRERWGDGGHFDTDAHKSALAWADLALNWRQINAKSAQGSADLG